MEWNGVVDYWSGLLDWTRLLKCHAHKYAMCSLNQSQSTTLPPRLCLTIDNGGTGKLCASLYIYVVYRLC